MILESVGVREATIEDLDFVYATWLRFFKHHSPHGRKLSPHIFFENHHKIIEVILAQPKTKTIVCCLASEPKVLLGYIVGSGDDVIHFVFVKESFRKFGIAKHLLEASGIDPQKAMFTHYCDTTYELLKKYPKLIHNPYLAYKGD